MQRLIRRVAVLGSGVMGSRIACHFAGAGLPVLLLDIVPDTLTAGEVRKGLRPEDPAVRNRIARQALEAALKSTPAPVFTKEAVKRITTGNFADNLKDIADCDWIIEAVVENPDIKRKLFDEVEKHRSPGTLITSNTSGIPIHTLSAGRSADFRQHFCGTHFFNPPRYLRLLEVIPTPETDPAVTDFLLHYGDVILGKTTVLCKDTPAFIANRVGVFSMMAVFRVMSEQGLNVDEVDALTGTVIGHPKSATFRTADVVGIDTLVKVAKGLYENCPHDEARELFRLPSFLEEMVESDRLGDKTGQGFYRKVTEEGKKEILTLNLETMEYGPRQRVKLPSLEAARAADDLKQRVRTLYAAADKAGGFYRHFYALLFSYISHRIPEITEDLYQIDAAMRAGFGWELGPFECWDLLGVEEGRQAAASFGLGIAPWVEDMPAAGCAAFYKTENGKKLYYDIASRSYQPIPGSEGFIILENFSPVWKSDACKVSDIGDGVLAFSWSTKMNTIGGEVLQGLDKALEITEKDFRGLVLANDGANFSAGANVALIFLLAAEQEWEELDVAIRLFQRTSMRIRYSAVPVVAAPHGLTLGGGCEFCLHADSVQAAAETYIGLVEAGVGLIPAGGGTKEFALRASDAYQKGQIDTRTLQERFITIGTARVAGSAYEAFEMDILRPGYDEVTMNMDRRIGDAKQKVLQLSEGYRPPLPRKDIKVLGRQGLGALLAGIHGMWRGHYITDYDTKIAQKLAYVMCGGDLTEPSQVSEQYLLDLEREAFLSLCGERKTLERLQSVVKTGKPVRN